MIRLLAVDDHPAILTAIERAAGDSPDVVLVGAVTALAEARRTVAVATPDVVVCDVWLGNDAGGLRLIEELGRRLHPRVVVYTGFRHRSYLRAAFEAGAAGYVSKAEPVENLLAAIRTVGAGQTVFPATTLSALREAPRGPTNRELETIRLLAGGATNEEIAGRLGISIKTVESHLRRLFGRYDVLSRTELAVLAVREGWVAMPE